MFWFDVWGKVETTRRAIDDVIEAERHVAGSLEIQPHTVKLWMNEGKLVSKDTYDDIVILASVLRGFEEVRKSLLQRMGK
jgi:hypothetical protein